MAEITVQIILSTLQTAGLLVGIFYYIMTLRNQQKNQRAAEESQQLQFIMQIASLTGHEGNKMAIELLNMEWKDYDEFERKYGSDNNPDNYAKRNTLLGAYNMMGLALKRGLVDRDLLFETLGYGLTTTWAKFEGVLMEIRRRYNQPTSMENFQYLAEECSKWFREKGHDIQVPDTFYRYIPDQ